MFTLVDKYSWHSASEGAGPEISPTVVSWCRDWESPWTSVESPCDRCVATGTSLPCKNRTAVLFWPIGCVQVEKKAEFIFSSSNYHLKLDVCFSAESTPCLRRRVHNVRVGLMFIICIPGTQTTADGNNCRKYGDSKVPSLSVTTPTTGKTQTAAGFNAEQRRQGDAQFPLRSSMNWINSLQKHKSSLTPFACSKIKTESLHREFGQTTDILHQTKLLFMS